VVALGLLLGGVGLATWHNLSPVAGASAGRGKDARYAATRGAAASLQAPAMSGCATPSFGAASNFAVGTGPRSVAVGDLNSDGRLDLVTANSGSNNVSVRLGDGAGSFGAATNFGPGNGPVSVAVGDLNGDGKLDLATANVNSANVSVLLNTCTPNQPPTLTPIAGLTRTAGSPLANSQIATASDAEDAANVLRIQISNGGPFGDAATFNGVTVTLTDQNTDAPNVNPAQWGRSSPMSWRPVARRAPCSRYASLTAVA
jgi:hypothetical protein